MLKLYWFIFNTYYREKYNISWNLDHWSSTKQWLKINTVSPFPRASFGLLRVTATTQMYSDTVILTSNSTSNSYLRSSWMYQHFPNQRVPSVLDSKRNQSLSDSLLFWTYWNKKTLTIKTDLKFCHTGFWFYKLLWNMWR